MSQWVTLGSVRDGQTLTYPIVLLEGTVKNKSTKLVTSVDHSRMEWPISNSGFKSLVRLKPGWNQVLLECEGSCVTVKLKYDPTLTPLHVKLLYVVFQGDMNQGRFQCPVTEDGSIESACRRISLGAELVQTIYAHTLGRTFSLEPTCHVYHSRVTVEEAYGFNQEELWRELAKELVQSSIWSEQCKLLAFLSCTRYHNKNGQKPRTHSELLQRVKGHCALGGDGLALMGTGCLYCWPSDLQHVQVCLRDKRPVDWEFFMDDSDFRGTRGGCFSTTLGAVVHELGHTFDLGHTADGIMGQGFNQVDAFLSASHTKHNFYWSKSCTALLTGHRWFNPNLVASIQLPLCENHTLKSPYLWRVIEARDPSGTVLETWTFGPTEAVHDFQLTRSKLWLHLPTTNAITMIAQDSAGNILKCDIKLLSLPQSCTVIKRHYR